jgi:hypothetical protein
MAIEKGLYAAPEGIDDLFEGGMMDGDMMGAQLEIEIVDPEMVTLSDGSMEITLIPDANEADLMGFDANLAEALDDNDLQGLAQDLVG